VTTELDHPFTFDEIHKVTLLFVADPQATLVAKSLFEEEVPSATDEVPSAAGKVQAAPDDTSRALRHSGMRGVSLTPDTLALLSLLSDETNRKVERYLQTSFPMNAAQRAEWEARREELRNADVVKQWQRTSLL
jgi:hypothetical protein